MRPVYMILIVFSKYWSAGGRRIVMVTGHYGAEAAHSLIMISGAGVLDQS
jgi:hypothetical protein